MTDTTKTAKPARPFKQEALLAVMQGAAVHFAHEPEGLKAALAVAKQMAEGMVNITQQWANENAARQQAKGEQE